MFSKGGYRVIIQPLCIPKKNAILLAATELFSEKGYDGASISELSRMTGAAGGTIFHHFENKEALFQCITQGLCDNATQVSDHPYDKNIPLRTQLHTIAEQEMAFLTAKEFRDIFKMITSESLASPELTKTNFDNFKESSIGVVKWIRQAVKDGKLSVTDPVRAGKQFLALIEAFALWPQLYDYKPVPNKNEQKKIIDSTMNNFL